MPRLPAASTHAGPGLQPSNLRIIAQQAAQQAAARVLAHFALPSAAAPSTAFAPAPPPFPSTTAVALRQPAATGSSLQSSQVSLVGYAPPLPPLLGYWQPRSLPAPVPPLQPQSHGFTSLPFSLPQHIFGLAAAPPVARRSSSNLRSALASHKLLTNTWRPNVKQSTLLAPSPPPLYPALLSTPLVLFPRKGQGNGASLCTYVSYPPGSSVNDSIHNNDFPLRYSTVYDAIDSVMRLGRGALMAKIDIKSAFRLCPVHPSYHNLFGMKWRGSFYFDHVLPFGLMSAPFIFNCLAIQQGVTHIHHCLDDFFVAGSPDSEQCSQHLHTLVSLCTALGVQLDDDNCLEYLGILLDSALLEACLPAL